MSIPYHDARQARLEGRRACLGNEPRISRYRALGPEFAALDAEWCKGYDEAARHPDAEWFDSDGMPWRCGARTKAGAPCRRDVDRKGYRCATHRERPPPHPGPQLGLAL